MSKKKVLLIEDQPKNASEIKNSLVSMGYDVAVAGTIDRGLLRAKAFHFDMFVVNCGDGGKDGFTFASNLKKGTDYINNPFIFTYNPKVKVDVRLRKFTQPFDIIRMPFDANEMIIRVDRVLNLPSRVEEKQEKATESATDTSSGNRGKVLLVEDNPLNQKVLGMFISKLGFEFDIASNGQSAVDACAAQKYAFILMDIYMPGMDGPEATMKIREGEQASGHRARIIAITANESEESVKRCYDSGMDDYLVKPFTLEILKDKLI